MCGNVKAIGPAEAAEGDGPSGSAGSSRCQPVLAGVAVDPRLMNSADVNLLAAPVVNHAPVAGRRLPLLPPGETSGSEPGRPRRPVQPVRLERETVAVAVR